MICELIALAKALTTRIHPRDAQSNKCNPVGCEGKMHDALKQARKDRHRYGNICLLLQLLAPFVDGKSIIAELPAFYDYAGDD